MFSGFNVDESVSSFASKLVDSNIDQLSDVMPVVIIGSGPAGLAAGVYTIRAGLPTLVIEGQKPGGVLTTTSYIENWPAEERVLGAELMQRFKKQNQLLGVQFLSDQVVDIDFTKWPYKLSTAEGLTINALSVIIATGAKPKSLGLPNEQKYWGHGVSSCAVCDAPFYKNKNVIVVGGGDSAFEQVLQLAPHVKSVTMLVRKDQVRASKSMQNKVAAINNAKILFNTQITQLFGNDTDLDGVELLDNQTNIKHKIPIDGLFLAIGHDPATQIFKHKLMMDAQDYLILEPGSQQTSVSGVFAAGEVVDHKYRQAGVASGDGIKAALDLTNFMQNIGFNSELDAKLRNQYFDVHNLVDLNKVAKFELAQISSVAEFETAVLNSKLPVVLDFYTDYCSACLHMLPVYKAVAIEMENKVTCFKIDADAAEDLVRKLEIKRVPTLIVYQNGELVERIQEVLTKKEMRDLFGKYVN